MCARRRLACCWMSAARHLQRLSRSVGTTRRPAEPYQAGALHARPRKAAHRGDRSSSWTRRYARVTACYPPVHEPGHATSISSWPTYYGVSGATDANFVAVTFPPGQRAGLLTQGSFMGNFAHGSESSPVLRGKFILTQLACSPPEPPPDDIDTTLPPPDPTKSARQQLVELTGTGRVPVVMRRSIRWGSRSSTSTGSGVIARSRSRHARSTRARTWRSRAIWRATMPITRISSLRSRTATRAQLSHVEVVHLRPRPHSRGRRRVLTRRRAQQASKAPATCRELILGMTETPAFLYYRANKELTVKPISRRTLLRTAAGLADWSAFSRSHASDAAPARLLRHRQSASSSGTRRWARS